MDSTDLEHERASVPESETFSTQRPENEKLIKGILATTIAASSFTIQIFLPALPAVQAAFDVTAPQVQLTISLPLLITALATLIYGPLSDRYGRRPVLIFGMTLFFMVRCFVWLHQPS